MKKLSVLAILSLGLLLLTASFIGAEGKDSGKIISMTYQKESATQESLVFRLSEKIPFKIFALGGDKPRIVVDFQDAIYAGEKVDIPDNADFAVSIRSAVHRSPELRTRVVIDLQQNIAIKRRHKFIDSENHLKVILTGEKTVVEGEEKKTISEKTPAIIATPEKNATSKLKEEQPPTMIPAKDKKIVKKVRPAAEPSLKLVPRILKISFDNTSNKGEMILFHLNDFYPPTVSAVEKGEPVVLCEFLDARITAGVNKDLTVNGRYVERIRTTEQKKPAKVRVRLELAPDKDYDLQQVFFKNDNLFVLIVNELPLGKDKL